MTKFQTPNLETCIGKEHESKTEVIANKNIEKRNQYGGQEKNEGNVINHDNDSAAAGESSSCWKTPAGTVSHAVPVMTLPVAETGVVKLAAGGPISIHTP